MATRALTKSSFVSLVISALLGALLAGASFYVVWASSVPTEGQVIELIKTHSPYKYDQKLLLDRLSKVDELDKSVQELSAEIRELRALISRRFRGDK